MFCVENNFMPTLIHDDAPASSSCQRTRVSHMHQKLQTALSKAEKAGTDLTQCSRFDVDRSISRYRNTAALVSFMEPATSFSYAVSFMPGVHFYTFLAGKTTSDRRRTSKRQHEALKLNVPDTILYGESGRTVRIYTDRDGYVRRETEFNDKQVLEKLANSSPVTPDGHHFVVYKEPLVTMAPTEHQSDCNDALPFTSQGTQLHLLNLGEVRTLLEGNLSTHKSFALQEFVKCNASTACIQRSVYEAGKPSYAWLISNIDAFHDENVSLSPHKSEPNNFSILATSETQGSKSNSLPLVHRLCTNIQTDKACTFVKLTERACTTVSDLNLRLVRYIEQRLGLRFQTFVADFIKDLSGNWWFCQVKAFQVEQNRFQPGRVVSLSQKLRRRYCEYRDMEEEDEEEDESLLDPRQQALTQDQKHKSTLYKLVQCNCCLASYPNTDLSFKLTLKMIHELHTRLGCRLSFKKSFPLLSVAFQRKLPESRLAYESSSVCRLCYAIYEREQQLQQMETTFAAAVGVLRRQEIPLTLKSSDTIPMMPRQVTLCRLIVAINAIYDLPADLFDAEREIESTGSRLYLRLSVLGYTECIALDFHEIQTTSKNVPVGETWTSDNEDDDEDGDERDDSLSGKKHHIVDDTKYWLPLNLIRMIPFFAPQTPLQSRPNETSGLTLFLTEETNLQVHLIRATQPPFQDPSKTFSSQRRRLKTRKAAVKQPSGMKTTHRFHSILLGSTKIRLTQFRSSYVTKSEYYASMALTGDMLNLKGTIGLERLRYVDFKLLTTQFQVGVYHGVYLPDPSYGLTDALSLEWMDYIQTSSPVIPRRRKTRDDVQGGSYGKEAKEMDEELEQMIEKIHFEPEERDFKPRLMAEEKNGVDFSIKQELDRDISLKEASQVSKATTFSPRLERSDSTNNRTDTTMSYRRSTISTIVSSPRHRNWLWSFHFRVDQAHHLYSRERLCRQWECHYTLFTQRRSALERLGFNSSSRSEHVVVQDSVSQIVQFNCTHKFWFVGTTMMIETYLHKNREVKLYFRNNLYASTRSGMEGEFYGILKLDQVLKDQGVDTTIDIFPTFGDPTLTPREATAMSSLSPYLTLSMQLSKMSVDMDGNDRFKEIGCTLEGLRILRQVF